MTDTARDVKGLVADVKRLTGEATELVKDVRTGDGTLGKLVKDDDLYRDLKGVARDAGTLLKRADGTEFPVEIRVSLLDAQGQRSIVGIVRDVTERNRAQQVQQRLVHDLGERVKELTALHTTGRLLNEPGSPDEVLAPIVNLLPAAWQYPDITAARDKPPNAAGWNSASIRRTS